MDVENLKTFSIEEISKHNTEKDCWIIIKNKVYDITKWVPKHPGGSSILFNFAGKDCSDEFKIFHLHSNHVLLKSFLVGKVSKEDWKEQSTLAQDFELLHDKLKKNNAFKPDYWFYFRKGLIILSLFIASITLLLSSSSIISCFVSAVCLGLFWQQLAFIGHDLGHHVVTHNRKLDDQIAIFVGNLLQGISVEWWKHSHNTHHTVTNSINYDPDIQHLPVMAVSKEFFKNVFSTYHKRVLKFDSAARWFISIQHYMFYVIMALARFNLYAQSYIYNIIGYGSKTEKRKIELLSLAFFWVWYGYVLSFTSSWSHAVLFLFMSHAVAGLVHVQICISHFAMETYHGIPQSSFEKDGYIRSQLLTTMNVDCYPFMDFFHGGLQFQIEHHLFPHLTRSKFRYAQKELKELCEKHNLPYVNKSFYHANKDVVTKLYETSQELKLSSMFWDGINMIG